MSETSLRTNRLADRMPGATSVLEVDSPLVRFGQTDVLRNLTFTVAERTVLAIIGPNGAGKTVLMRALLGSIPFQGTVRWAPRSQPD
jgi:zinc transport system ATP-binding protein